MLGSYHHVGRSEQGVGASGEHSNIGHFAVRVCGGRYTEVDVSAFGSTDPVALHRLDRVGPVEQVEVFEKAVGIRGDAHHPLLHWAAEDREVATIGAAIGGDLFVGKNRAEPRAPIHGSLGNIDQAIAVKHRSLFTHAEFRPGAPVGRGPAAIGELCF